VCIYANGNTFLIDKHAFAVKVPAGKSLFVEFQVLIIKKQLKGLRDLS